MLIRNDINIGDKIWVYHNHTFPIETFVKNIYPYGIEYIDEYNNVKITIGHSVYKRPDEQDKLIEQIYSDIDCLKYAIKEIQKYEDKYFQ